MDEIRVFENDAFGQIRTAGTSEKPLFCLADVCKTLDLQAAAVIRRLEKGVISSHPLQTEGGIQQVNFVTEDGLYDVIFDSRKPEAKMFRKWVTSEVLPSIRKTGSYTAPVKDTSSRELFQQMKAADWLAKFLNLNNATRLGIARKIAAKVGMEDTLPTAVDAGTDHPTVHSATDLLKLYVPDMSARRFNQILLEKGIVKNMTRPGRGGKMHKWMVLTSKYDQYGQNQQDPQHQQQTQIRWYDKVFPALLSEVGIHYSLSTIINND